MKILKVIEFEPGPGKEFMATSYPHTGLFLLPNGSLTLVANGVASNIQNAAYLVNDSSEIAGQAAPAAPVTAGITENTLLKALAIAQNPALAVQLTSEPT